MPFNIIRPNWFMQNFNTFWAHGIKEHGTIRLPVGDARTGFIDARDISAVAVRLLTDDTHSSKAFTLTGPESLTHGEVAAIIAKEIGKPVSFTDADPEELKKVLLGAGLPADYVDFLLLILGFLKAGYSAVTTSAVKDILGREPGNFARYAKDYRASWV